MGRPNKIRQHAQEATVRKLAAEGLTSRQISDRLKQHHKLDVSHTAVARFIQEETQDRRDAARSVASEEAKESVPLVTAKLRKWVETIDSLVDECMETPRDGAEMPWEAGDGAEPASPAERAVRRAKQVSSVTEDVSRLVNAGVKAAKALHEITTGDGAATGADGLRGEVLSILAAKAKREDADEE